MNHVFRAIDEQVALNAVRAAYPRLRFLDDLSVAHGELGDYFPETAAGTLRPRRGESLYAADGVQYVGRDDGSMVPIDAEHLEPMPENIWYPDKFSALVEAAESGQDPAVDPGYADLSLEGGALTAQVRDGNHRTFAPVAAGGDMSWVMMSDSTRQDLDERVAPEALYRAVRTAQRAVGAPLFKRRVASKVRLGKRDELLAAERRYRDLTVQADELQRGLLRVHGRAMRSGGWVLDEQLRRPSLFWRARLGEMTPNERDEALDTTPSQRLHEVDVERMALGSRLYDLRREAGLKHGERLDPATGMVAR